MTHDQVTQLAVKWLRYPNSRGGHGCQVAVSEISSGHSGERPDAIGFRTGGGRDDGSIVVEVKVSRGDFLSDVKKPHRREAGLGAWRYYMCPNGLIDPIELPEKWGLINVVGKNRLKLIVGPFKTRNYYDQSEALQAMKQESDFDRERFILARLLGRIGDVDEANKKLKAIYRERNDFANRLRDAQLEIEKLRSAAGMVTPLRRSVRPYQS